MTTTELIDRAIAADRARSASRTMDLLTEYVRERGYMSRSELTTLAALGLRVYATIMNTDPVDELVAATRPAVQA